MPDALVDLHLHTDRSDGAHAPAEVVRRAVAAGLAAVAVTDHDTLAAWPDAAAAGREHGVEVVPGIECSVRVGAQEVHLLGYAFDPAHERLRRYVDWFRTWRRDRARHVVAQLGAQGVPLPFGAVEAQAGTAVYGRPHVARALVAEGLVETEREAFDRYLGPEGTVDVPVSPVTAATVLALLHEAGGVGVLAHPGHWTSDRTLMALVRAGLDGVECVHPSHDAALTRYYRGVARDFALLETGGSDYHGTRPGDEERLGRFGVPYALLDRLRRRAAA